MVKKIILFPTKFVTLVGSGYWPLISSQKARSSNGSCGHFSLCNSGLLINRRGTTSRWYMIPWMDCYHFIVSNKITLSTRGPMIWTSWISAMYCRLYGSTSGCHLKTWFHLFQEAEKKTMNIKVEEGWFQGCNLGMVNPDPTQWKLMEFFLKQLSWNWSSVWTQSDQIWQTLSTWV